ncbi:MAG: phosphate signaling complex protein PhoU [Proteobacteria bacterium]|nr:phosphate signaling complex protein PhoU [Pseudomonadota bacterium]
MTKRFEKELEKIKKLILSLGAMAEEEFRMAVKAIELKDAEIAQKIIKNDYKIDDMEVEIEEECLKVLALHQPVAVDLRFIVAVIKINNDLERIGDEAVNIAERVESLAKRKSTSYYYDYSTMSAKVETMLKMSLDALVNLDIDIAFKVLTKDDEVDAIQSEVYRITKQALQKNNDDVAYLINQFLISRHLERIADHATNIAEEVIYLVEGEIVRHGRY